jgi:Transposase DDE domain group 1
MAQIRGHWAEVVILVRGDSAYGREDIMHWCESQAKVEYVVAYPSNERLRTLTWGVEQRAKAAYEQQRRVCKVVCVKRGMSEWKPALA